MICIFLEIEGKELSLEACRSMVAMVDVDRSGRLEYPEFRELWTTIMEWKNNFKTYDKDGSGDMNAIELRGALAKLGFKLSTPVLSSLTLRYANRKGNINFDDFLQICCRIKSTFGRSRQLSKHQQMLCVSYSLLFSDLLFVSFRIILGLSRKVILS